MEAQYSEWKTYYQSIENTFEKIQNFQVLKRRIHMPDLGPMGRGGARRRTRRRMMVLNEIRNSKEHDQEPVEQQTEVVKQSDNSDKLKKLAKLLKDKGVITEIEYNLLFE